MILLFTKNISEWKTTDVVQLISNRKKLHSNIKNWDEWDEM